LAGPCSAVWDTAANAAPGEKTASKNKGAKNAIAANAAPALPQKEKFGYQDRAMPGAARLHGLSVWQSVRTCQGDGYPGYWTIGG